MSDVNTEAMDIAALATSGRFLTADGAQGAFVVAPNDWKVHSLEHLQPRPNRITENHVFSDVGSLAAYLKAYATPEYLMVTSDARKGCIRSILDYHAPAIDSAQASPQWTSHVATFHARFTPEYEAWRKLHRNPISQVEAGEFLEDRIYDIAEPSGGDVMDMVMKFDALKKVTFSQSTRLRDGTAQIIYSEENEARGALTLPDTVTLMLPIYDGMEPERIKVRLRFRVGEGKLAFTFVIANIEQIERQAFRRCEDAFSTAMPGAGLLQI